MANNEALHVFLFGARIAALGPLGRLLKCKRLKLHRGPPPGLPHLCSQPHRSKGGRSPRRSPHEVVCEASGGAGSHLQV